MDVVPVDVPKSNAGIGIKVSDVQTSVVEKIKSTSKTYQKISLLPNGDSEMEGSFTVSFRSHTTAILSYDVSDTDLKIQLETLLSIGVVSVTRTGSIVLGYSWTFTSMVF